METCFADTPRIKDNPFRKRIGDNLLSRDINGYVDLSVGHFLPSQILARKIAVKKLTDELKQKDIL